MPTMKKSRKGRRVARRQKVSRVHESRLTFSALPDDVLLEIFDFYLDWDRDREDGWDTLVHVCKRWRCIVFASPHRLQLRLLCTNKTPTRVQNMLDIWPELPIVIRDDLRFSKPQDARNIIATLKQHDRVCEIDIGMIPNAHLKRIRAKMKNPFSALSYLRLHAGHINPPALPDSFLGGSAPRLQTLYLSGIIFPALPKLLLSTLNLVELELWDIPPSSRYTSPEVMVTSLSALPRLGSLVLDFRSPRSLADREKRHLPRMARIVLPALTAIRYKGDSEYLEDIVAQIDTPLLKWLYITFFNQLIFDTPLLGHFLSRTETFNAPHEADVRFRDATADYDSEVQVMIYPRPGMDYHCIFMLVILCRALDRQLSSIAQVCNSALSPLTTLECLSVSDKREDWEDDSDNSQWVGLLHPFTSVKDLFLDGKVIQLVARALEELAGGSVTEVLPAMQNLVLLGPHPSKPDKKAIRKFVTGRRLSGRPVAIHCRPCGSETWQQVNWEVGDR